MVRSTFLICSNTFLLVFKNLHIRDELRFTVGIYVVHSIFIVGSNSFRDRFDPDHESGLYSMAYLLVVFVIFELTLMICAMVLYPQRRMRQSAKIPFVERLQRDTSESSDSWQDIVVTDEGYEVLLLLFVSSFDTTAYIPCWCYTQQFANFLEQEFSIENLLFVTEVCAEKLHLNR